MSVLARAMETLTSEMPSDASIEVSDGGRDNVIQRRFVDIPGPGTSSCYLLIYCVTSQAQPQTFCRTTIAGILFWIDCRIEKQRY